MEDFKKKQNDKKSLRKEYKKFKFFKPLIYQQFKKMQGKLNSGSPVRSAMYYRVQIMPQKKIIINSHMTYN